MIWYVRPSAALLHNVGGVRSQSFLNFVTSPHIVLQVGINMTLYLFSIVW